MVSKVLYNHIYPWLRTFTMSFFYEDQLPGEHTVQGLSCLGLPVSTVNLNGMHIFCQFPSPTRCSFYQPTQEWKSESTFQQWSSNLPPFAQESDALSFVLACPVNLNFIGNPVNSNQNLSWVRQNINSDI